MAGCARCGATDNLEIHHVVYRSNSGGNGETQVLCHNCHVELHRERGDYAAWGRGGAAEILQRRGGEGRAFLREIGQRGGQTLVARRGRAYMARIGRKGGNTTVARHGPGYMAELGRKGGKATASRRNEHTALEVNA